MTEEVITEEQQDELEEMVEAYEEAADKLAELAGDTAEAHLWSNDFNKCIGAIRGIRNETKDVEEAFNTHMEAYHKLADYVQENNL